MSACEAAVALSYPAMPQQVIAYRGTDIEVLGAEADLSVRRLFPGVWSNRRAWCVNEQDLAQLQAA